MAEPSQINVTSTTANASRNLINPVAELTGKRGAILNAFISLCSKTLSSSAVCYTNTNAAATKLYLQPDLTSAICLGLQQPPFALKRRLHYTQLTRLSEIIAATAAKYENLFFAQAAKQLFVSTKRYTIPFNFISTSEVKLNQEKLISDFIHPQQALIYSKNSYSQRNSYKSEQQ